MSSEPTRWDVHHACGPGAPFDGEIRPRRILAPIPGARRDEERRYWLEQVQEINCRRDMWIEARNQRESAGAAARRRRLVPAPAPAAPRGPDPCFEAPSLARAVRQGAYVHFPCKARGPSPNSDPSVVARRPRVARTRGRQSAGGSTVRWRWAPQSPAAGDAQAPAPP